MEELEQKERYNYLFEKYYPPLLFYASRFLSTEEASDVVQDVFFTLWQRRYEIEMGNEIQAFLYRSVYTHCLNVIKHNHFSVPLDDAQAQFLDQKLAYYHPDHTDVIDRLENQELANELKEAINHLPDKCKSVFCLSYLHDLKNKEIADVLNISLRTVEAHMYKALKILRNQLKHLK